MATSHIAGEANDIADIPSRSFSEGDRWNCPSNAEFLTKFAKTFPLPQGASWQLFILSKKISTRLISELLMQPLRMDAWLRLPKRGYVFGTDGATTSGHCASVPTSTMSPLAPKYAQSPALVDRSGRVIMDTDVKSLALGCKRLSPPSARPVNWSLERTPSSKHPSATSNP